MILLAEERGRTARHYDLDPAIFALVLGTSMKYSPGLYEADDDTLEVAQQRKMGFIAEQLGLRGGERILDIGCGWGAVAHFLAARYGCPVIGVTPAGRQAAYIEAQAARRGLAERIRVEVAHFQETDFPAAGFDAIVLVGSIVHMADRRGILAECRRLLRPRGRVYLSETCFRNRQAWRDFGERPGTRFVRDDIFGWGAPVTLSTLIEAFEDAGFSLIGLRDLTWHFSRTIDDWRRNVEQHHEVLEAHHPGLAQRLLHYFEISNAGWGYAMKQYAVTGERRR